MATTSRLMDHIRRLVSDFTTSPNVPADRNPVADARTLRSPAQGAQTSAGYPGMPGGRSGPRIASTLASASLGRHRFGNQGGCIGAEHTRSNLG